MTDEITARPFNRATMVTHQGSERCVTTNLPIAVYRAVEERAKARGISKAGLLRDLINKYLAETG